MGLEMGVADFFSDPAKPIDPRKEQKSRFPRFPGCAYVRGNIFFQLGCLMVDKKVFILYI
jgi:hypothetical protein